MTEVFHMPLGWELRERVEWLIRLRWLTALGTLLIVLTVGYLLPGVLPLPALLATIACLAICNGVLFLYARWRRSQEASPKRYLRLTYLQIALDLVFLTVLLHFLGGLETPFFFFYLIYVVLASILFSRRASFAYAGLASFLFLTLIVLEWLEIIPHYNLSGFRSSLCFQQPIQVFIASFALTVTALLSTYFASGIVSRDRERQRELLEAQQSCEVRAQECAELNVRLRSVDEARSDFIYLVTHELRAPVSAIQSYLKLILEGYVPPEREREIIQRAEYRARDQLALISDLLDLARLESPRTEVEVDVLDLGEVLQGVSEMMRTLANEKGLSYSVQIDRDLPPVKANPEHMKQLWTNLISNAIKYTLPGGTVTISLVCHDGWIVGTVQDTGIGIADKDLPRIFKEFYRAENAKSTERHGTGLGLSIAKRIVDTYGGQIGVESELGRGSTFTSELPVYMKYEETEGDP